MSKTLKVKVSAENINDGDRGHAMSCPIALALNDMGMGGAEVWPHYAYFWYDGKEYYMRLPREATKFIFDFDNEYDVESFEFEGLSDERYY